VFIHARAEDKTELFHNNHIGPRAAYHANETALERRILWQIDLQELESSENGQAG
jgi:hypothetical protein